MQTFFADCYFSIFHGNAAVMAIGFTLSASDTTRRFAEHILKDFVHTIWQDAADVLAFPTDFLPAEKERLV